jgi:hypothetical protein
MGDELVTLESYRIFYCNVCLWLPKVAARLFNASVCFAEISWFWRENFQTLELAVAISNNFAKADAQNPFTRGDFRPEADTQN